MNFIFLFDFIFGPIPVEAHGAFRVWAEAFPPIEAFQLLCAHQPPIRCPSLAQWNFEFAFCLVLTKLVALQSTPYTCEWLRESFWERETMVAWHYKFFPQSQLKAGTGCPVIQEALRAASKARSKKSSKVFILSQHRSRAFVQHFPFFCQPASFHSPPFVFASALFLSPRFVKGSRIMRSVWRSVSRNLWGKSVHSVAGSTVFFQGRKQFRGFGRYYYDRLKLGSLIAAVRHYWSVRQGLARTFFLLQIFTQQMWQVQYHEEQDSGWWEWRNPRQCGNASDTTWWPTLQPIHLQSAPVTDSIAGVCCASGKFCCFCEMELFKTCGQPSQQIWHLVFLRWLSRSGLQLDASFHLKVDAGWMQCRKCIGIFSNTLGQILPDCPTSAKLRIHRAALQIYCSTGEGIIESENIIPQFKKSGYVNT